MGSAGRQFGEFRNYTSVPTMPLTSNGVTAGLPMVHALFDRSGPQSGGLLWYRLAQQSRCAVTCNGGAAPRAFLRKEGNVLPLVAATRG